MYRSEAPTTSQRPHLRSAAGISKEGIRLTLGAHQRPSAYPTLEPPPALHVHPKMSVALEQYERHGGYGQLAGGRLPERQHVLLGGGG